MIKMMKVRMYECADGWLITAIDSHSLHLSLAHLS